jgi:hypothetical protein
MKAAITSCVALLTVFVVGTSSVDGATFDWINPAGG